MNKLWPAQPLQHVKYPSVTVPAVHILEPVRCVTRDPDSNAPCNDHVGSVLNPPIPELRHAGTPAIREPTGNKSNDEGRVGGKGEAT